MLSACLWLCQLILLIARVPKNKNDEAIFHLSLTGHTDRDKHCSRWVIVTCKLESVCFSVVLTDGRLYHAGCSVSFVFSSSCSSYNHCRLILCHLRYEGIRYRLKHWSDSSDHFIFFIPNAFTCLHRKWSAGINETSVEYANIKLTSYQYENEVVLNRGLWSDLNSFLCIAYIWRSCCLIEAVLPKFMSDYNDIVHRNITHITVCLIVIILKAMLLGLFILSTVDDLTVPQNIWTAALVALCSIGHKPCLLHLRPNKKM